MPLRNEDKRPKGTPPPPQPGGMVHSVRLTKRPRKDRKKSSESSNRDDSVRAVSMMTTGRS